MNVAELLEEIDPLENLEKIMQLRATASKLSQENAEAAFKFLDSSTYRWKFETFSNGASAFHIIGSSFNKNWSNMPGKTERINLRKQLQKFGFQTAPFRNSASAQKPNPWGGPHVYFW